MPKCDKCGKEYELSKEDERLRKQAHDLANNWLFKGMIHSIAPGLQEAINISEHYCNACYHSEVDFYTQAITGALQKKKESGPEP